METRRVKQPRLAATKKAVPQGHRFFGLSSGLLAFGLLTKKAVPQGHRFFGLSSGLLAFGLLIDVVGEEQVLQDWAALLLS